MSLRAKLGRVRRTAGYSRVLLAAARSSRTGAKPLVAYVGWTGEGNLGDEAMFAAHVAEMGFAIDLVPLPISDGGRVLRSLGPRLSGICLGGGTLIGNGHFRRGLEGVMRVAPDVPRFMVGTGAESLDYRAGRRKGVDEEFRRWVPLLAEFEHVQVRGPLSVETLARVGVSGTAVGDPALLLPAIGDNGESNLLGVNVGVTDDQWGEASPDEVLDHVYKRAVDAGWRLRLLPTTTEDFRFMRTFVSQYPDVELPDAMPSVASCLTWMAGCSHVIAVKLHAAVLAATQLVPVTALEYRPKCRDFMASLAMESQCIRLDELAGTDLLQHVTRSPAVREAQVHDLAERTAEVRTGLRSAFARAVADIE